MLCLCRNNWLILSALLPGSVIVGSAVGFPGISAACRWPESRALLAQCEECEAGEPDGFRAAFFELFAIITSSNRPVSTRSSVRAIDGIVVVEPALSFPCQQGGPPEFPIAN